MANRRSSLAHSSISTSRQSSLAYKGCSEPMNDAALQFKLSKKVAELTLVVHMLFTRNHEREVELEATKEAYEQEINSITSFFEKEIMRLKSDLDKEKWKRLEEMERLTKAEDESTRKLLERHNKNVAELTGGNEKLTSDYRSLEEKYDRVVEDHEQAKRDHDVLAKERIAKDRAMEKDHLRIEKLQQNARANKELMEKMKENIHNIQKSVNHKISQMDANNRSANEVSENLRVQNEQLEAENKALRKKIVDQTSQLKRLESNPLLPPCPTSIKPKPKSIDGEISKDEEIERLKREVHKYRLELSNREENFNKIFSDMNPVTLRNGGMSCVKELRDGRTETARSTEAVTKKTMFPLRPDAVEQKCIITDRSSLSGCVTKNM
ncbi:protein FAM184A-like isoform X3 [Bolinopsis microptera]|uniref:protein FAM184A-like isoform X3 n=1 Tax=Bolinopsis microptera TaxID=2820187 RepID=UPI00307A4667